jgi:hypothetical protein
MEYCNGRIYPNSVPEFRALQKQDGTLEMQVRYRNDPMGYLGKWMPIQTEQENDTNSCPQA